jgi:plastocyanin
LPAVVTAAAAACVCLISTPSAEPHGSARSNRALLGGVSGRVELAPQASRRPLPSAAYPTRVVQRSAPDRSSELANVLVYLKDAPRPAELPVMHAEIRQENEQFVPHVLAVTRGSTVDFPNRDDFFHNVFSLSGAAAFDLGRYPRGETRSRRMQKAGIVKIFCQLHSHMSAVIMVFDHPYFTRVGENGAFTLSEVPPGRYTLTAWHERIGESDRRLDVEAGRLASAAFALPVLER